MSDRKLKGKIHSSLPPFAYALHLGLLFPSSLKAKEPSHSTLSIKKVSSPTLSPTIAHSSQKSTTSKPHIYAKICSNHIVSHQATQCTSILRDSWCSGLFLLSRL